VKVRYTGGESNFVLQTLGSDNSMQELLVNTIGGYQGVEAMDFDGSSPAARLQITAAGPWTVTFLDPSTAPAFGAADSGSGDSILRYSGGSNTAAFTSNGHGNFAVFQYDATGQSPNLLVNTIGSYSGSVAIDSSGYLVITDDGRWTVALSST
jgi:Tol biopolymer transport system component